MQQSSTRLFSCSILNRGIKHTRKCQSSILNDKKLNKMGVKKLNFVFNMQGRVIG